MDDPISIDNDVPMPSGRTPKGGRPTKYPIGDLQIGQSFFVVANRNDITSMYSTAARHKIKISMRKVQEHGVNGLRIWRTA